VNRHCYHRAGGIRAFPDKGGGWTLVSRRGEFLSLRNAASLCLWEVLGEGADPGELTRRLQAVFPGVPAMILRRDAARFLRDLEVHGFVEKIDAAGAD